MEKTEFSLWWKNPGDGPEEIWTLNPDDQGETIFHLAPFVPSLQYPTCEVRGKVQRSLFPKPGTLALKACTEAVETTQEEHEQAVIQALDFIEQGAFEKVVISRSNLWREANSPESVFAQKCKAHKDALVYLLVHPIAGVWLGATPELLLRQEGVQYETVSMAGTRKADREEWTKKEMREQSMVTDFIAQTLKSRDAQAIQIDLAKDRSYGEMEHLESRIRFESSAPHQHWLQALHPTPAVGGQPRNVAMEFIAKHERQSRGYYAGYLGWSFPDGARFYVNLRCMQWFSSGARIFAGGGIIAGSDATSEWEETEIKIQSIRQVPAS